MTISDGMNGEAKILLDRFLQDLREKQKSLGLLDREFADRLGVSRELWNKISHGKREPSCEFIVRAFNAFEDMTSLGFYLLTKLYKCANPSDTGNGG